MQSVSINRFNLIPFLIVLVFGVAIGAAVLLDTLDGADVADIATSRSESVTWEPDMHTLIIQHTGGPDVSSSDSVPAVQVQVTPHPPGAFDY